jgi:hypothetical protein
MNEKFNGMDLGNYFRYKMCFIDIQYKRLTQARRKDIDICFQKGKNGEIHSYMHFSLSVCFLHCL